MVGPVVVAGEDDQIFFAVQCFQVVHHLEQRAEADIRQSEPLRNTLIDQLHIALKGACHAHMVDDDTFKALCSNA